MIAEKYIKRCKTREEADAACRALMYSTGTGELMRPTLLTVFAVLVVIVVVVIAWML